MAIACLPGAGATESKPLTRTLVEPGTYFLVWGQPTVNKSVLKENWVGRKGLRPL
jgi:hypothetical protein